MEGCAIFFVLVVAIIALALAITLRSRLREAQADIKLLGVQLAALQRTVRDAREEAHERPAAPVPVAARETIAPQTVAPPPTQPPPITAETPAAPVESPVAPATPIVSPAAPPPGSTEPTAADPIDSPPPSPAPPPIPPPAPAVARPAFAFDWENLVGIKLFSWIAGIALVLAAVFFLKYSVEHGWLSPTIRASMGILTGTMLLIVCERKVARDYAFTANAMHGAGIAILYATLFAVHALWHLLPAAIVFFLMLVVTAVAVMLSVRRDSVFIALLGLMGGFATPALLASGENRPIGLFSYLLLLNAGLGWVAYRKRWPALTIGSVIFTVCYQWGWVARHLTPEQLPLAAGIFVAFAAIGAITLWMSRDDHADRPGQRIFDGVALVAAMLPLAFGVFAAAVPTYGARYHTLFGFLLLVAGGLAAIAVLRGPAWLHVIGGGAVLLTFGIWTDISYPPAAWPAIVAWVAVFVVLYLLAALRLRTLGNTTAGLLFFMLPALAAVEARTSSPALLFGAFFALLGGVAFVARRRAMDSFYIVASVFTVLGMAYWTAFRLDLGNVNAALLLYTGSGLFFLAVSSLAQRNGLFVNAFGQRDRIGIAIRFGGLAHFALVSFALLMIVAARKGLASPPWPLLVALAVLALAIGAASLHLRSGSLMLGGALASQLVLLVWAGRPLSAPLGNVALAAILIVAAWTGVVLLLARRTDEDPLRFQLAVAIALLLGHVAAIVAGTSATPPLYGTLLGTHLVLAAATLTLAWFTSMHVLSLWSVTLTAFAIALAPSATPGREFLFAAVFYALFLANPLALGARVKRSQLPYLAAALASAVFFFFARRSMIDADLEGVIGVLPLTQALLLLLLVWRLLRIEPAGERQIGRLAMVAGTALAFLTVAIPLQLDRQWITLGWALEGAALVWLFRKIPHRGLLVWAAGLLGAAFVRLMLNPAVLSYHPASDRIIFNWYLYTYLVAAAACFAAAWWLPTEWKKSMAVAGAMGTVLLFALLNIEIADFFSTGPTLTFNFFTSSLAQELTYTIGWAVFALAMLVAGIAMHMRATRVAALVLLLVTILKCFLHDLSRLGGLYRVGSLLGLAIALVLVGILLQKFVIAKSVEPPVETPT